MARQISHQLFAALEWENLLGLDKEFREIKDLCSRRNASHYVVLSDAYNLRVAGLMPAQTAFSDGTSYSLAALLCLRAAGQPLLFVYALSGNPATVEANVENNATDILDAPPTADSLDQVIVIAINGGRPTLDRVLPRAEAVHEAALFAETLDSTVRLVGNLAIDGIEISPMGIPEVATLSDAERAHCQIRTLSSSRANALVKNGAAVLLIVGTIVTIAWLLWPAPAPYIAPAVVTVDEREAYYAALKDARDSVLAGPSYQHITEIQQLLTQLPIAENGWRAKELTCTAQACTVSWVRGQGATLEGLLTGRPNAKIQDDNYDQAIEKIALSDNPGSDADASTKTGLVILPKLDFYEVAHARASTLKDHGMEAHIGSATSLVPIPMGMLDPLRSSETSDANDLAAPVTAKGEWRIAGHLAFLDSVTGLLLRTGNMRLDTVDIDTDPTQPRFTAAGYFYVE